MNSAVEEWLGLVRGGMNIPLRLTLDGVSMEPLIRKDMDIVTITPLERKVRRGDIVLFLDTLDRYCVHRVIRWKKGKIVTRGDNCMGADFASEPERMIGLVVSVTRDGRRLFLDTRRGELSRWRQCVKIRGAFLRREAARFLRRWLRKVFHKQKAGADA